MQHDVVQVAVGDRRRHERVVWLAAAVRRGAGVEQPDWSAAVRPFDRGVPGDVRVAEDDQVGVGVAEADPLVPVGGCSGLVHDHSPDPVEIGTCHLR